MTYRQILVTETLHRRIKVAAAAQGQKIIEFVEEALIQKLDGECDDKPANGDNHDADHGQA